MGWLALAVAASLSADPRAGVLPVEIDGTLAPQWRAELERSLQPAMQELDLATAPAPTPRCADARCWTAAAAAAGVSHLVRVVVRVEDRDYALHVELIDAASGEVAAQSDERCEVCGVGEAGEAVAGQLAALVGQLERLRRPARLVVRTTPPGASVYVDGVLVGVSPAEVDVEAGEHEIDVRTEGYLGQSRTVSAVRRVDQALSFTLHPVPRRRNRGRRVAGWAALGVGLGLLVPGVALLAIDERPHRRDCMADVAGNCRFRYNTLTGGAVLSAAAVALVVTGVALVVSQRRRRAGAAAWRGASPRSWLRVLSP